MTTRRKLYLTREMINQAYKDANFIHVPLLISEKIDLIKLKKNPNDILVNNRYELIDTAEGIQNTLLYLGVDPSEVARILREEVYLEQSKTANVINTKYRLTGKIDNIKKALLVLGLDPSEIQRTMTEDIIDPYNYTGAKRKEYAEELEYVRRGIPVLPIEQRITSEPSAFYLLNYNEFVKVMSELPSYADIIATCSTSSVVRKYCLRNTFWPDLIRMRFGLAVKQADANDFRLLEYYFHPFEENPDLKLLGSPEGLIQQYIDLLTNEFNKIEQQSKDKPVYFIFRSDLNAIVKRKTPEGALLRQNQLLGNNKLFRKFIDHYYDYSIEIILQHRWYDQIKEFISRNQLNLASFNLDEFLFDETIPTLEVTRDTISMMLDSNRYTTKDELYWDPEIDQLQH